MAHIPSKTHVKRPVRLAESESIAVDLCPCGTLQLHLGALTLRLNADSLAQLLQTLGQAVVRAQQLGVRRENEEAEPADRTWGRPRGEA